MKLPSRVFSSIFLLITSCMLGIAFIFSLAIGFGNGLSDVDVPGLCLRFPDTWSPLEIRIFLLALILISAALLILAFIRINHAGSGARLRVLLLLAIVFLVLQLFIVFGLHTIQNTDAFEVQDQALAIAKGIHKTVDYTKSSYFKKYGNNDLYLIFCVQVFRFCLLFHIRAYHAVFELLNLIAVDLGIFMTCRTVFLLKGSRASLTVFLLSILNPLNILLLCWPYTCTLSMPLMMLCPWMTAALLKKESGGGIRFAEFLLIGITAVAAYYFRPTAVFPVIALILSAVCAGIRYAFCRSGSSVRARRSKFFAADHTRSTKASSPSPRRILRKSGIPAGKLFLIACAVLLMAGTSTAIRNASLRLDPITETKFPKMYWLMLGASGTGRFTGEEMHYTQRMDTMEEKKDADLKTIRKVLKERGTAGNLKHYLEKTGLTWSDGTAEYTNRTEESENSLPWLYRLLNGPGEGILLLWCQAYRILLLFMALFGVLLHLFSTMKHTRHTVSGSGILRKKPSGRGAGFIFQVCVITLLGGFVFYTFWEGKPVYSYPFLPYLILVGFPAWEKICRLYEESRQNVPYSLCRAWSILSVILLSVTGIGMVQKYIMTERAGVYDVPSIVCDSTALPSWVSIPEGHTLTQSFYPSGVFNTIRIRVKSVNKDKTGDLYRILVVSGASGDNGNPASYRPEDIVFDKTIESGQIKDGALTAAFPAVYPEKKEAFRILITNLSAEGKRADGLQSSVRFGTRLCYVMDEYKGDCVLNGRRHPGDLLIRVSQRDG